jgi:hypothetical protein
MPPAELRQLCRRRSCLERQRRPLRLIALARGYRPAVVLEGTKHQQVAVEDQRGTVPFKSIQAMAAQRHLQDLAGIG